MSFCRNCGAKISDEAEICISCGVAKGNGDKFCPNCGSETSSNQAVCLKCGVGLSGASNKNAFTKASKSTKFYRIKEGKLLGGVFSGAEKCYGINRWLGRIIMLFVPLWPIWLIIYIVVCTQTEMIDN
ncbi:MAG: zinc-ribbon domain-containing protein [Clostridia bacterium]|nr:zinc-ribbon domain-containing protein [Clostridia bacterium]